MDKKESNIELGLSLDTGIEQKNIADISEEEKQIAINNERDVDNQVRNDSMAAGVANFRLLSR